MKRFLWILPLSILALEYIAFSLIPHRWFTLHIFRGAAASFALALIFFGRKHLFSLRNQIQLSYGTMALHVAIVFVFCTLTFNLNLIPRGAVLTAAPVLAAIWLAWIPLLLVTGLTSFIKTQRIVATAKALGSAWIYASICALSVAVLRDRLQNSWDRSSTTLVRSLQEAAFNQSHWGLHFFYPVVRADPSTHILGTPSFLVEVAGSCSGLEGLALMSVSLLLWLFFERRTLQLLRAILLIPLALGLMWVLNVIRLVILIAIGTGGHPDIAINGFHAQAGWICFNGVALAVLLAAQRITWFQKSTALKDEVETQESPRRSLPETSNPTAIYLAPFFAIIVASLVAQSVSSQFEWLYPLRFVLAAGALFYFRKDYLRLNWQCGWLGVTAGLAVALLWLAAPYAASLRPAVNSHSAMTLGLAALSPYQRLLWITFRFVAAILTVPIAEELAFRGFLARRSLGADFEMVPFSSIGALQILVSAILFGLMHGRSWFVGILAGVIFAWVAKRTNRFGEAVGAHIVANLAIAFVVLVSRDYTLWG